MSEFTNKKDKPENPKASKKKHRNGNIQGRTLGILAGICMIAVGIGYIGNVAGLWNGFTVFFRGWWTVFIILPALAGVLDNGLGSFYTAGLLVGLVFLIAQRGLVDSIVKLLLPTLFIYIGLRIIFRNKPFGFRRIVNADDGHAYFIPVFRSIFAPRNIKLDNEFPGADVSSWFAPITLDLTQAKIEGDAAIRVSVIFAPVTIKINPEINLRGNKTGGFSNYINESKNYSDIVNMPTLHISAGCIFSNVTIKN